MKKILYIIFIFYCQTLYTQWVQQVSGVPTALVDLDFINENTGWACGDNGMIVKTTNGGVNWLQQTSGIVNRLEGIDAVDANIIWCVGWWNTILKSTDGGSNWQIIRSQATPAQTFRKVFFLNSNTGWLLKSNYILRTTNGGSSFDSTNTVFTFLWDIYFKNALTGVLCGDAALTMKSTDGGVSWTQINLPLLTGAPNLFRLSFAGDVGCTIGEGSEGGLGKLVFKTTNFGSTWDSIARVPYPNGQLNYSVFLVNQNTGYCGGTSGLIYKSTNSGTNWIQQNSPSNGYRSDFWFANDTLGWSTGGGGQIFKTTNGGTFVNIQTINANLPKEFKLHQNYPNPFNGSTIINFEISKRNYYKLELYNSLGQMIKEIFNKEFSLGVYSLNLNTLDMASGTYFYKLSSESNYSVKKFILIK